MIWEDLNDLGAFGILSKQEGGSGSKWEGLMFSGPLVCLERDGDGKELRKGVRRLSGCRPHRTCRAWHHRRSSNYPEGAVRHKNESSSGCSESCAMLLT